MAVIHTDEQGKFAILDEQVFYADVYRNLGVTVDPSLYDIHNPYMMDSAFEAWQSNGGEKRRGKKRKHEENEAQEEGLNELYVHVKATYEKIQEAGRAVGHFYDVTERDNNQKARQLAKKILSEFPKLYNPEAMPSTQIVSLKHKRVFVAESELSILNSWFANEEEEAVEIRLRASSSAHHSDQPDLSIYLPPNSTFHIGNATDTSQFCSINDCTFDLIVADPPWYNRSVQRNETYEMDQTILKSLSMEMLSEWGILAMWISNATGLMPRVEKHLNRWNLHVIATWAWLKVTKEGDPVCEFKSHHKLPYEVLLLCSRIEYQSIPSRFIFASVPMGLHSRKPPLLGLFKSMGFNPKNTLELFARSLLPCTTSVGFEPLLCQSDLCFVKHVKQPEDNNGALVFENK
ncbi:hypothetical protein WR25_18367 [Diploscapter pachys]|uniref:Methyltransferase-like protein 4 n=1 Tax=Diploscapter pachys TaxID=2018661 RepID=A0A2A2JZD6_9BILA|nr:hypothetical protein WR25_18367 [Diploscapter pachys]